MTFNETTQRMWTVKKSRLHVIECSHFNFCLVKSVLVPVGQVSVIAQVPVTKVLAHEEPGHRGPWSIGQSSVWVGHSKSESLSL